MKESALKKEMFMMGLSPRHKGFHYLSTVMMKLLDESCFADPGDVLKIACSKANVGQRQAECCMRYAIRYAWDVNNGRIHQLFPDSKLPPTPLEFLNAFLWSLDER